MFIQIKKKIQKFKIKKKKICSQKNNIKWKQEVKKTKIKKVNNFIPKIWTKI